MMRQPIVTALLLLLFAASPLPAQDQTPAPVSTPSASDPLAPKPKPRSADRATDFTLGLAWQGPTRLTGSATLMWGRPKMLVAWAPGKLLQVRAGSRGGQVGLGFVTGVFEESPFKPSGIAVTLKAIALRTWRDPSGAVARNYAGLETDIVLLGIRGSLGYARRISPKGASEGRFIWSVGLGL